LSSQDNQKRLGFAPFSLHSKNDFYSDIFLCRINSNQQVECLKHIDAGRSNAEKISLTMDDDKNIYLTGSKDGTVFVSKYDSAGTLVWNNDFGKKHSGNSHSIALDLFDYVYVIGGSGWEFLLIKLDFYGEPVWTKKIRVNSYRGVYGNDIAVDALGNIYFTEFTGLIQLNLMISP
jgi:hypothetical protein